MTNLKSELERVKKIIDDKLANILPVCNFLEARVLEAMRYSLTAPGKRVRPFLVMQSAQLLGVHEDWAIDVGVALECVHTYSLIHDDLPAMDDDDLRRGIPTCHKKFDEATAILAGDALLTYAFELIAKIPDMPAEIKVELVKNLAHLAGADGGMVAGQMLDILMEDMPQVTQAEVVRMQSGKTGALFTFSLTAGPVMAEVNDERKSALQTYAQAMGLLFQITDDLLDVVGDEKVVGKKLHKDATFGKGSWVAIFGLEQTQKDVKKLVNEGKKTLSIFGERSQILADLLDYIATRKS
jgi:farnesyl diphosphate synthase